MKSLNNFLDKNCGSVVFNLFFLLVCIIFSALMLASPDDISIGWLYFFGFATGYWFVLAFYNLDDIFDKRKKKV